jgi:hypothetical protein
VAKGGARPERPAQLAVVEALIQQDVTRVCPVEQVVGKRSHAVRIRACVALKHGRDAHLWMVGRTQQVWTTF